MALSENIISDHGVQLTGGDDTEIDFISELTGKSYKSRHVAGVNGRTGRQKKVFNCPWPYHTFPVEKVDEGMGEEEAEAVAVGSPHQCKYVFHRVYDLRRHLLSVHKLQVDKAVLGEWARAV
jgi:hypothetical protein